jgi:hypothetical protein
MFASFFFLKFFLISSETKRPYYRLFSRLFTVVIKYTTEIDLSCLLEACVTLYNVLLDLMIKTWTLQEENTEGTHPETENKNSQDLIIDRSAKRCEYFFIITTFRTAFWSVNIRDYFELTLTIHRQQISRFRICGAVSLFFVTPSLDAAVARVRCIIRATDSVWGSWAMSRFCFHIFIPACSTYVNVLMNYVRNVRWSRIDPAAYPAKTLNVALDDDVGRPPPACPEHGYRIKFDLRLQ